MAYTITIGSCSGIDLEKQKPPTPQNSSKANCWAIHYACWTWGGSHTRYNNAFCQAYPELWSTVFGKKENPALFQKIAAALKPVSKLIMLDQVKGPEANCGLQAED